MTDTKPGDDMTTVMDADADPVTMDADMVTMVTTEKAAAIAGVSARTVRRWIQQGHLASVEGKEGKLVSPADLLAAKEQARRGHGHSHVQQRPDRVLGHDNMTADTDTVMTAPALSSATAQMEAIRDEWLRPLIDRIE